MKIAICGSFAFARQMVSAAKKLTEMGHLPILPIDTMAAIEDISIIYDVNRAIEKDIIRDQLSKIIESDAILVLNYDRSGVPGYIGGSSLIEWDLLTILRKKFFFYSQYLT